MGRGRPPDRAPDGFYTVTQAALLLRVTPAAVRGRIERGTLPTKEGDHLTEGLETRHYIPKDVVDKEASEKNLPANRGQIDDRTMAVITKLEAQALLAKEQRAAIEEAVKAQDEHISSRLDRLQKNQEAIRAELQEAVLVMRAQAELEKKYQSRMIEMLDQEAERQAQREREGLPERRSIWRRLFGS